MFILSVKLSKKNEKLERNIIDFKNYIEFLESSDKRLGIELHEFRLQSSKSRNCELCDSLKNEVKSLHETLG